MQIFQSASLDDLQIQSNDLFAWTVSSRFKAEQVNKPGPPRGGAGGANALGPGDF